ncbi:MAG: putative hemolysin [Kiritimatiellia bacterium]|jgi:putative hemolysin
MIATASAGVDLGLPLSALLILTAVLLLLSFVFSGTETAMFSLQKLQRKRMANGHATARRVSAMLTKRNTLIATILIGNETVNIAFANTGATLFDGLTPYTWLNPWLNVLAVTPVLVLVSEITPKILGYRFNVTWSHLAIWPLTVFHIVVSPIRWVVTGLVTFLARRFGVTRDEQTDSLGEEELLTLLQQGTKVGNVGQQEREIIENVFDFDELSVGRLMTPRPDVFSLPLATPWKEIVQIVIDEGYSRMPVHGREPQDVLGVLLMKDVLKHRNKPPAGPQQLRRLLMPPVFVPQSKPATDMFKEFLEHQVHLALVVDEHGTIVGLVTLDDLLTELFGDFADDAPITNVIEHHSAIEMTIQAQMDLEDFGEETAIILPEGEYHTVGGFIYHELGRLPEVGDSVQAPNALLTVETMEGRQIGIIRVYKATNPEATP